MEYNTPIFTVLQTEEYKEWFRSLRDRQLKARIDIRVRRLSLGNAGDVKPVGQGVSELRIHFGAGYRIYFIQKGDVFIMLLTGGDKKSQQKDIEKALELAEYIKDSKW